MSAEWQARAHRNRYIVTAQIAMTMYSLSLPSRYMCNLESSGSVIKLAQSLSL